MDAGPVNGPAPAPSWKLADAVAEQTQACVVTGFSTLSTGYALFLRFDWPSDSPSKGFLDRLMAVAPVTSAAAIGQKNGKVQTRAASVAFTATGLRRMGLSDAALASFSRPFQEGMFQEDRLRRLGDRREGKWLGTVMEDGPIWSANTLPRTLPHDPASAFEVQPPDMPEECNQTSITVHALLLLYAQDTSDAATWVDQVRAVLADDHIAIVRTLDLVLDVERNTGFSREHFGFADALSQPQPFDQNSAVLVNDLPALTGDPVQGVPLGEFLIGHINGHQEPAPGPVVADSPAARRASLPAFSKAEGFCDLGVNGSYLVARELRQDVAAFWQSMERNAAALRMRDPEGSAHVTGTWLADRVVGRDRNGHLLCPGNKVLPACSDGSPDSSFRYFDHDPDGRGCPAGSHVRRAFPRDALAPTAADKATLLQAANNHRILRRGRKFGTRIADPMTDDGAERGLLFMCLNTDIERQFEFVQQTWLLNGSFATLFEETDPLVGPAGRMTLRDGNLRRIAKVDTFVRMAGGDYFFLPSLPALRYLALL
jgi:deferrochelatase/peroxidase EfeB